MSAMSAPDALAALPLLGELTDAAIVDADTLLPPAGGTSPQTRYAARAVLLDGDGRIALLRSAQGIYLLPGGGIEPGETPADAARREVAEEAGRDCRVEAALGLVLERRVLHAFTQHNAYYLCRAAGAPHAQRLEPDEAAEAYTVEWHPPDAARALLEPPRTDYRQRYFQARDLLALRAAEPLIPRIAPMNAAHTDALAALEAQCFSRPWSGAALAAELTNPHAVFLTALLDGEPVGYAGMHVVLDEGAVTDVAVHPTHRRRGIGHMLTRRLCAEAAARGAVRLTLEVRESNDAARQLYGGLGFTVCGRRRGFYEAPAEDGIIYEVRL